MTSDGVMDSDMVQRVIKSSLALAAVTGADVNMVYVIAAYHDLGMAGPRAIHHITSGKILIADARLRKWFSAEQLKIMRRLSKTIGQVVHVYHAAFMVRLLLRLTVTLSQKRLLTCHSLWY